MIVREEEHSFVMIEQDVHGRLAEEIMRCWKKELFPGLERRDSVMTAVRCHDCGWRPFDQQPFWNDATQKPYQFTNFPLPAKLALYSQGIDEIEQIDTYAALLCSEHYSHFLKGSEDADAKKFLEQEQNRRKRLLLTLPDYNETIFKQHYGLLQLGDNFSLYSCINSPGVLKGEEHPFFLEGIPTPEVLEGLPEPRLDICFKDLQTIVVEGFPFEAPFQVSFPYRNVQKEKIERIGLVKAFENRDIETATLRFEAE